MTDSYDADVTMRIAASEDAQAVVEIYAPSVRETAISFERSLPSVPEVRERIESTVERYPWVVCEHEGRIAGYAAASELRSASPYDWTVELSARVHESDRRSGVGSALYASLLAVRERQRFCTGYAVVTVPNRPSVAFHGSRGLERVGVCLNAARGRPGWAAALAAGEP